MYLSKNCRACLFFLIIAAKYEHSQELLFRKFINDNMNLLPAYAIYFKYKTSVNTFID